MGMDLPWGVIFELVALTNPRRVFLFPARRRSRRELPFAAARMFLKSPNKEASMHAPRGFTPVLYLAVFMTVVAWGVSRPVSRVVPPATAAAHVSTLEVAAIGPGEIRRVTQRMVAH
jgi:hypothetical protein